MDAEPQMEESDAEEDSDDEAWDASTVGDPAEEAEEAEEEQAAPVAGAPAPLAALVAHYSGAAAPGALARTTSAASQDFSFALAADCKLFEGLSQGAPAASALASSELSLGGEFYQSGATSKLWSPQAGATSKAKEAEFDDDDLALLDSDLLLFGDEPDDAEATPPAAEQEEEEEAPAAPALAVAPDPALTAAWNEARLHAAAA